MFSKFAVDTLKIAPKIRAISFFSTTKNLTPATQKQQENKPKDWKMETASRCDTDKIISFVEKHFLSEEPLCRALIPGQAPKIFREYYQEALDLGLSVVAKKICGDKEIIGVCLNHPSYKLNGPKLIKESKEIEDLNLRKLMETWGIIESEPKINETLCEDAIFLVCMLSVHDKHYGKGIGLELVKKSLEVAAENNFKYAKMNCTNENTMKIAKKLKMEHFWSIPYKDLLSRGNIKPRALPEPPHHNVYVYYTDLKTLPSKC